MASRAVSSPAGPVESFPPRRAPLAGSEQRAVAPLSLTHMSVALKTLGSMEAAGGPARRWLLAEVSSASGLDQRRRQEFVGSEHTKGEGRGLGASLRAGKGPRGNWRGLGATPTQKGGGELSVRLASVLHIPHQVGRAHTGRAHTPARHALSPLQSH